MGWQMVRKILRDDQWERIERVSLGKLGGRGQTAADNRLFVEAVPWIARTGSPWRAACPTDWALGTALASGLPAGRMPRCGGGSLRNCGKTLILQGNSLTARLSAHTNGRYSGQIRSFYDVYHRSGVSKHFQVN